MQVYDLTGRNEGLKEDVKQIVPSPCKIEIQQCLQGDTIGVKHFYRR
jgi:hypothetical protein